MADIETDSIVSLITSLLNSFRQVPPAAIPAMIDCVIASTSLSPSSVLSLLFNAFPNLTKDIMKESGKLDSEDSNYIGSIVAAFCCLLKKSGANTGALQLFIWKFFIPLMKLVHDYNLEILNEIVESFFDVVIGTNTWVVVEVTLVPFFLRLVGLSMGMLHSEDLAIYKWSRHSAPLGFDDQLNELDMDEEFMLSKSVSFPLRVSCHILTSILNAALLSQHAAGSISESILVNGSSAETISGNLLWDLCNMTIRMLSQDSEHRSAAMGLLLPTIFKAFVSNCSFEISTHGQTYILSRNHLFTEIWKCCRILFSLGPLERKDAYGVLSLHLSFFSYISGCEDVGMGERDGGFDLRAEKEFWEEIKRGLVDKEGLVRKHSLHILKMALHINEGSQCYNGVSETISSGKDSAPLITKREMWADKEAKSLGVGKICHSAESSLNSQQKWGAFLLLYEMLEEYGTHLVEAAWNRQITLLLHLSFPHDNSMNSITGEFYQNQMDMLGGIFIWLAVLWERGFCHHNPQVRCLIMQSFLGIEWKTYGNNAKLVPEEFVIGPLIEGLNDPVHHKDFGIKGVYSSRTIQGATKFLCHYTTDLSPRKRIAFLNNLASVAKQQSFGRAGLMCFAECIASAACGVQTDNGNEVECCKGAFPDMVQVESDPGSSSHSAKTDLVEDLRYVIETSKRHFNSNYRLRVCEKVLEAAASVICASELSLEILLHFISILPREFTDYGGSLRIKVHKWLLACGEKHRLSNFCCPKVQLLKNICDFPRNFTSHDHSLSGSGTFDDEDLDAWAFEAERWARVLFLVIKGEHHIDPILTFIKNHGVDGKRTKHLEWVPVRFLILVLSLIQELQIIQERMAVCGIKRRTRLELGLPEIVDHLSSAEASVVVENFTELLFSILEELISFARSSSLIFWSNMVDDTFLPCSIRGKLGGPSQRRLSSSTTTAVLQAVVASISLWCSKFRSDVLLNFAFNFLWQFFWKIVSSSKYDSETEAEIFLASYEALAYVSKALASTFSSFSLNLLMENDKPSTPVAESRPLLDSLVITFLQNINNLIAVGKLVRSRRAILINWKWICMESLLSIPTSALMNGVRLESGYSFFSDATVRWIFSDLVDSLENAGEGSVLHMLRSVRLVLELFASGKTGPVLSSCNGVDAQMMWHLVRASWILHISCNKRRVAPIAALLSSVLHYSVFVSECMHETDNAPGPVKWFVEKILEEGTKSPRTIRLAALHLTGLWLSTPRTIKYYMKELKLLTLYGSVAFDEDFEAEIADNHDARSELSALGKSPDPELTEAFINTELYARVSVAVLFNKLADLADMVGSDENENCFPALESGKLFLLELLDSVVNDNDLAKELYKKYSGIHRRKVRAWQMICILARFIDQDILQRVIHSLHIALHRNNLPAVRQYLETFAIHMYLKFPSLVGEHLVPVLRDYDMRPQALSSYVFIAANVILHSTEAVQSRRLDELLPPIIPLLTSHHHSLRGFTQLLVYQVLHKVLPPLDSSTSEIMPLEKRCFEDLKLYLGKNSDCARLRASMEGYLDAFNPRDSVTPAGIFANRVEEDEFECVSISLMDQVIAFLNDVREDLRCSMAKDAVNIKNESLRIDDLNCMEVSVNSSKELPKEVLMDFQKKITFSKHEAGDTYSNFFSGSNETYKRLMEMQKEDQLLDQLLHSRSLAMEKLRASRQDFILVASLLDRIPNLAGLARTCEVFKAAGLAIADANILHDKQFQLISVTAEKWVPIIEVPVSSVKIFLEKKKREGFSILGLEQTANSIPLDQYSFPKKTVLVLGREKEGIPVELIHILDACIEIPQLGVVRSLNVHVSGAIALWEYTRQQISR
ncbi:uncharacterized protein LOC132304137 isoform X2 [Cornus florida]|uniref:uncharacterized protein LOC132304137 isoform X2 n=1 Tax=Cornus florida TaxID=4283 RepID=UPI00289DA9D6|nr:uncharacterized protein LOC132304137 isoform X2 [Cornus florida]